MAAIKDFVQVMKGNRIIYPNYLSGVQEFVKQTQNFFASLPENGEEVDSTPEEVVKISEIANVYSDMIVSFLSDLKKFTPSTGHSSSNDSIKDLEYIQSLPEIKKFHLDPYDRYIGFTTRIKMKDVFRDIEFDFGLFKIIMYRDRVQVSNAGENTEKNKQYHPYVQNSKLCLGGFLIPYKVAMATMNYHAAFIAVMKCLTQYGGDEELGTGAGPHNPIQLWVGQVCSICDDSVDSGQVSLCEKTKRIICPKCIDLGSCTDEVTKEIYHPDVLKRCKKEGCGKNTHTVIRGVCLGCRQKALE